MLSKSFLSLHRALLFVVVVVALTATGFAHRMVSAQDGAQDGALAFALANGADASDFCGSTDGDDRASGLHCPACQISASADLQPPAGLVVWLDHRLPAWVAAPTESIARRSIRDPAHSPQGPPAA